MIDDCDAFVLVDVVTAAVMRRAGVDPQAWLDGLDPEVATPCGQSVLLGFKPSPERRQAALGKHATAVQRLDILDVVDDDGTWRVAPSGHIEIAPGVNWLARTTLPQEDGRYAGLSDRGALSIQDHGLPETIIAALPGTPLASILDLGGTDDAVVESASTDAGYLELVVDAPWARLARPAGA